MMSQNPVVHKNLKTARVSLPLSTGASRENMLESYSNP